MPSGESSLASRVAFGTAVAAAIASCIAVTVTVVVTDRLMLDQEDRRLHGVGAIAMRGFPLDDHLGAEIDDEIAELGPEGIHIAVRWAADDRLAGGDGQVPLLQGNECRSYENRRACATTQGRLRVVASQPYTSRTTTVGLLAALIAIVIAAIAAAVIGRRTTRWALAPLFALRDSLSTIKDDPRSANLASSSSHSEITALRSTLSDLLDRLGDSLDHARRFSSDAAHELKTPLTAIRAELDLLAEEKHEPHVADAIERLRTRVVVLGRLVERLLALTKATSRAPLETETLAMEDVLREVVDRLPAVSKERVRVRVKADAPGMVNGDELLLAALVENAVENALKFSGNKPIDVSLDEAEGRVVLEVTDDGPGLPPDERSRVFEPFFRARASRATTPGHGVGLAIVAQVASTHRGTAEFVEGHGRGACLRVTIPAWTAT